MTGDVNTKVILKRFVAGIVTVEKNENYIF